MTHRTTEPRCKHENVQSGCNIPGACQYLPPVCLDCGETLESDPEAVTVTFMTEDEAASLQEHAKGPSW